MTPYAAKTKVPISQSRAEIERLLVRAGAEAFAFGWEGGKSVLQFRIAGRFVRFTVPAPDARLSQSAYEQAERQRWRAMLLVVKGKLESVESGIETFEEAFLAHVVVPDGSVVKDWLGPQLERAYRTGRMGDLLELGSGS